MFDVSFTELLMIGVIALVVIGPERLPKVARTIGHLVGRAQRYVSDVKSDIQREMDLEDISSLKHQLEDASKTIKETVQSTREDLRKPLADAEQALNEAQTTLAEIESDAVKSDAPEAPAEPQPPLPAPEQAPEQAERTGAPQ